MSGYHVADPSADWGHPLASDIFSEPKRRVSAAKEHINLLDAGIRLFLDSKPYAGVIDIDQGTGNETHKITLTNPIPDALLTLADQIVEGLRAALDKTGYVAARAAGNTRLRNTYFPIADTDQNIDNLIGSNRCRDIPDDILKLFRSFKPYKAGNPLIWGLNQLANGSKHKILVPVGISIDSAFLESFHNPGLTIKMEFPPRWDPENNEMVFCIVGPGSVPKYNVKFGMIIEIIPIDNAFHGQAADIFRKVAGEVERIILATENECLKFSL